MARLHTLYIINSRSCIIVTKQMQSDEKRFQHQNAYQTADEYYHLHVYRNIFWLRNILKAQGDCLLFVMSSKPIQTHTLSFTIISRIQCWLYSIIGQIIMSHYFHVKKKSVIISIVLVKFLTVVRWMYKIPSERCHNTPARAWRVCDTRFTAETAV